VRQLDTAQPHVAAADIHPLPGEEPSQRLDVFLQQRERARRPGAHLVKPAGHAVSDPHREPAGMKPGQSSDLHGGERHVTGRGRDDAHADPQRRGRGQDGRRLREGAVQEAVFRDPDFGEPESFGLLRVADQLPGRDVRWHEDAGLRHVGDRSVHRSPPRGLVTSGACALAGQRRVIQMVLVSVYWSMASSPLSRPPKPD
jgi:catechol 2,3-dioxygenase-like lactoylglutathione lyase family enzyme